MIIDRTPRRLRRLRAIFEDERAAILSGNFARLDVLEKRKAKLAAELQAQGEEIGAHDKAVFLDLARHNQAMLQSAANGFKTAMTRVAHLRASGLTDKTYQRDGTRTNVLPKLSDHDRRA